MIYQQQFSLEQSKRIARAKQALDRLEANPKDAVAVIALYETYGRELQAVADRHFGKNRLAKKAVLNLLVAVVERAWTCDPESMNASEWVSGVADVEARRLRAALDASGSKRRHTRRAM